MDRVGTALVKSDIGHRAASFLSTKQIKSGSAFNLTGGDSAINTLVQTRGSVNSTKGIFEFILTPNNTVSHQRFIKGGKITGLPNQKVKKK